MKDSHKIPKDVKGCYAVIFSYQLSNELEGYADMDQKTIDAVVDIPGYLGYDKFGDGNENTFISILERFRKHRYLEEKFFTHRSKETWKTVVQKNESSNSSNP